MKRMILAMLLMNTLNLSAQVFLDRQKQSVTAQQDSIVVSFAKCKQEQASYLRCGFLPTSTNGPTRCADRWRTWRTAEWRDSCQSTLSASAPLSTPSDAPDYYTTSICSTMRWQAERFTPSWKFESYAENSTSLWPTSVWNPPTTVGDNNMRTTIWSDWQVQKSTAARLS